jgi:PucR family transcriptional regulator, purine catabolism regulatory protein
MPTPQLPLSELLDLGLRDHQALAGKSRLDRPVAWVKAVAAPIVDVYKPAPAELILLIPPYGDLAESFQYLALCKAAGVVVTRVSLPPQLLAWAENVAFPIILAPGDADLVQTERELLKLLIDKEAGMLAREVEIRDRLVRLARDNRGLEAIARGLFEITHKGVIIHDKRLQVLADLPPPAGQVLWAKMIEWAGHPANLPEDLRDRKHAGTVREPIAQSMGEEGSRLIHPIIVRDIARGFMSLVSSTNPFDLIDRIALEQGAAACALEMAKVKAVSEARKRLTGDLIEAILTNSVSEVDAGRWADRAGYRRAGPHLALTLQWASAEAPSMRRLETIVSGEVKRADGHVVAQEREGEIVVFHALEQEQGFIQARQWAQHLHDLAREEFPHAHLALGLGRPSETLLGLRQSYREAVRAMTLERKLRHGHPQYFGDLGIYRLLLQLEGSPELRSFSNEILGSLIEYDRAQGTDLVETLNAYFQHNGNLAQTAQALYVHRNTLLYRLQRAGDIGKFDLDNAETRLAIQLALRAFELSREESDFLPPL